MKKLALIATAAFIPLALPTAAYAQETSGAHPYIGAQIGLHDLGVDEDDIDDTFEIDDSAMIYGVYGGVDFDIGSAAIAGVEGNFNLGNGPLDSEYGIAGRVGFRAAGGTVVFARAGYQWVNYDINGLLDLDDEDEVDEDDLDIDDTDGDWMFGVGADIGVGPAMGVRVAVDTISFDTLRATLGVHTRF